MAQYPHYYGVWKLASGHHPIELSPASHRSPLRATPAVSSISAGHLKHAGLQHPEKKRGPGARLCFCSSLPAKAIHPSSIVKDLQHPEESHILHHKAETALNPMTAEKISKSLIC